MLQLFGNGFGQDESTANFGTSPAVAARGVAAMPISIAAVTMVRVRILAAGSARSIIGIGRPPLILPTGFSRLGGSQSRRGGGVNGLTPSLRAKRSNPCRGIMEEW